MGALWVSDDVAVDTATLKAVADGVERFARFMSACAGPPLTPGEAIAVACAEIVRSLHEIAAMSAQNDRPNP